MCLNRIDQNGVIIKFYFKMPYKNHIYLIVTGIVCHDEHTHVHSRNKTAFFEHIKNKIKPLIKDGYLVPLNRYPLTVTECQTV